MLYITYQKVTKAFNLEKLKIARIKKSSFLFELYFQKFYSMDKFKKWFLVYFTEWVFLLKTLVVTHCQKI